MQTSFSIAGPRFAKAGLRGCVSAVGFALLLGNMLPGDATADAAGEAASQCQSLYSNLPSPTLLAGNYEAQKKIRRCILMGIDPPIKARKEGGTRPAADVSTARIASDACPPFAPCLTIARAGGQSINAETEGGAAGAPPPTRYSAPQFSGHLPEEWPEALEDGGTIYFYGSTKVTPPDGALIYSGGSNFYSDGATISITDRHIAVKPAPGGNIMAGQYVVLNQDSRFNFDDGGIVVLPNGFKGIIQGQQVIGGDIIIVNHAGDMRMPKGTKLYPFPSGSHPNGSHIEEANYKPYSGPQIQKPGNPKLTINPTIDHCAPACIEPVPGLEWF